MTSICVLYRNRYLLSVGVGYVFIKHILLYCERFCTWTCCLLNLERKLSLRSYYLHYFICALIKSKSTILYLKNKNITKWKLHFSKMQKQNKQQFLTPRKEVFKIYLLTGIQTFLSWIVESMESKIQIFGAKQNIGSRT